MVEILLTSKPSRATVTRMDTGEVLGTTPVRAKLPRDKGYITLQFQRQGYYSITVSVDPERDGKTRVKLKRIKSSSHKATKKSSKKRRRHRRTR